MLRAQVAGAWALSYKSPCKCQFLAFKDKNPDRTREFLCDLDERIIRSRRSISFFWRPTSSLRESTCEVGGGISGIYKNPSRISRDTSRTAGIQPVTYAIRHRISATEVIPARGKDEISQWKDGIWRPSNMIHPSSKCFSTHSH